MEIEDRYRLLSQEIAFLGKGTCTLCAVSKQQPVELMLRLYRAGCRHFGENRPLELEQKRSFFKEQGINDIIWHFIGHIQSRQIPLIITCSDFIHSVHSKETLLNLEKKAALLGLHRSVLLQVNVTGEASKQGFSPEAIHSLANEASIFKQLTLAGLMTMAEFGVSEKKLEETFHKTAMLAQELNSMGFIGRELSMGMSSDYVHAMNQGSTFVRIGSALFKSL
jgi:pyridoxal phosphate enzyme (YggS family)